jgi:Cd2+/Zn2+-exporting ATPase
MKMEKENKVKLVRIVLSAVLLAAAWALERCTALPMWQLLLVYMVPYLVAGYDVLLESGENIAHGEVFDEDFLMAVATMGALAIGFLPGAENQFPEAVFVMIFFQVGELFEDIAEGRSRRSIAQLMDLRPDTAHVVRSGRELTVAPGEVQVGETLVVKPGEKVPVDGVVLEGRSSLDTVALTGESVPRGVAEGDTVVSGCVNLTGVLKVRAAKAYGESTASKILELVENASSHKSHSESFIARFARVYTPVVVGLALLLAVVPSVVTGQWATWVYRGLVFLVVSCPCALVISVPLTFFSGIGGASRLGVLVKGANYLEALARVGIVVFDKTGTLTKGTFEVTAVHPDKIDERQLLHLAAHVERYSNHPIALSLRNAYPDETDGCKVDDVQEMPGLGVHAVVNGETVNVGNEKLMASLGIEVCHCDKCKSGAGTVIHVAIGNRYAGHIVISDRVKDDAALAVARLKQAGVKKTVMLTGDYEQVGAAVARQLGLDEYHAQLMPADKVAQVERLLACQDRPRHTGHGGRRHQRRPCAGPCRPGHRHGRHGQRCRHRGGRRGAHGRQAVEDCRRHPSGQAHAAHCPRERCVLDRREGSHPAACRAGHGWHGPCRVWRRGRARACCAQCHACPAHRRARYASRSSSSKRLSCLLSAKLLR